MPYTYTLKRFELHQIDLIKDQWDTLFKGSDMTFNQSFSWNKMLTKYTPVPKGVESYFILIESDNIPVMIAPLWIIPHRLKLVNAPGIYLIGRYWYTDYINLIYDRFDTKAFHKLAQYIYNLYGNIPWYFELLKKESHLYMYLNETKEKNFCNIKIASQTTCAKIQISKTQEEYLKKLKKSMLERLKRIANRSQKDKINFEIIYDDKRYYDKCINCYEERNKILKKRVNERMSKKARIYFFTKNLLYERWQIKFPKYTPHIDNSDVKILAVVDKNMDEVAAFLSYVEDKVHKSIQVVQLALNEKYSRYSPGIACAKHLIDNIITYGDYEVVDFTRGNEQYKYDLGGETSFLSSLKVKFSPLYYTNIHR